MTEQLEMRWVKYRTRHSSGPGQWDYRLMETNVAAADQQKELIGLLEELNDELTTYSEHWRGIDGDFENPPAEWLDKEKARAESRLADAQAYLDRVKADREAVA